MEHGLRSILKSEGVDLSNKGDALAFDAYIESPSNTFKLTVYYENGLNEETKKVSIEIEPAKFFKLFERVNFIAANPYK